jgi:hypothetical protein
MPEWGKSGSVGAAGEQPPAVTQQLVVGSMPQDQNGGLIMSGSRESTTTLFAATFSNRPFCYIFTLSLALSVTKEFYRNNFPL